MRVILDVQAIAMLERMSGMESITKDYWQKDTVVSLEQEELNSMVLASLERIYNHAHVDQSDGS